MKADPGRTSSVEIFKSIVGSQTDQRDATQRYSDPKSQRLLSGVTQLLENMERKGQTVAETYACFEQDIYPQIRDAQDAVASIVKEKLVTELFARICREKARDFASADLPSVSRLSQLMVELGVLKPAVWANLVIELIQYICQMSTSPTDYTSIESYENSMARRDAHLHDLMGAWKTFTAEAVPAPPRAETPAETTVTETADLGTPPPKSDRRLAYVAPRKGWDMGARPSLANAFAALFPDYPPGSLIRPSWAAYATFVMLADPFSHNRAILEEALPFSRLMRSLLDSVTTPDVAEFKPIFAGYPRLLNYILSQQQQDQGHSKRGASRRLRDGQSLNKTAEAIHKQVGQAIKARSVEALNKSWLGFWGEAPKPDEERARQLQQLPDLFNYFILAYMRLRHPQLSFDVWNRMIEIGVRPTIKAWTALIQGCTYAKNSNGIKVVWDRLVASGIKLDTAIWTARVSGLIIGGDPRAGLAALNEMAEIWKRRDAPENNAIAVQPSIEPVNAALACLIRLDRMSTAKKVLAWAAKHGINPDIYTFNTLLRPLVRQGKVAEAQELFDMMQRLDVQADDATYTILLDAGMAGIAARPPEEQAEAVSKMIRDLKSAGFEANMQTYAKMVYLLLQEGDRASSAVKAVLAHIWGRGLELTPHIYTMLAEHYFSRSPPDAAAVTALIEDRRLHTNPDIDRVFWERVIKGYCAVGEIRRALDISSKVFATGTILTFSTLYDFLRALIGAGEMEAAKALVTTASNIKEADEILEETRVLPGAPARRPARVWKHRFWYLAEDAGLLEDEAREKIRLLVKAPEVDF